MVKYLMFKHYRGPKTGLVADGQWTPEEWNAHLAYMKAYSERLRSSGEFVANIALTEDGEWIRAGRESGSPEVEEPLPDSKELVAGMTIIDVDNHDRARELASELSAAPGPGGGPLHEWLELRRVMEGPPAAE